MRWQAPSERVQAWLVAPIAIPAALVLAAAILPVVPLFLLSNHWDAHIRRKGWHRWFAWRPVRFDGFFYGLPSQWLWLETVERKLGCRDMEYRLVGALSLYERRAAQGGVTEGRDGEAGSGSEATSTRSSEGGCAHD